MSCHNRTDPDRGKARGIFLDLASICRRMNETADAQVPAQNTIAIIIGGSPEDVIVLATGRAKSGRIRETAQNECE